MIERIHKWRLPEGDEVSDSWIAAIFVVLMYIGQRYYAR